jgi:hypothetical protein
MSKKKKPLAILVTGIGPLYLDYSKKMIASLMKTNPKITEKADIILMTDKDFQQLGGTPREMLYMTPWFAKHLMKDYKTVVRIDSDAIVTGDITSCWEGDFDVAVAHNANPREIVAQQQLMGRTVNVWDIDPLKEYVNCGFVVMKSERFVDHWIKLCTPERQPRYQFYEQDFLNILCYYGDYKVKFLDNEPDNKWWGLRAKGYWSEVILKDKKLILPKKSGTEQDQWPEDTDKELVYLHFAGGNQPGKFDKLDVQFQPEVAKYLKYLISHEQKA